MHKAFHNKIEQETEHYSYHKSNCHVAQIMHTKIEAGEGCGQRPEDERDCNLRTAEKARKKDCHAHGVAGMTREEAKSTSTILSHHIHHIHEVRVLSGSPTLHHWLHHPRADSVSHDNEQGQSDIDHDRLLPCIVLEDDNEQGYDDQRP